ncbi:M56 family metallopeptidase, partial [uncultured Wocania sp.]|uniref:M56 family metallopeptidase n=1 Tax=uncultured Wocania sp. TaxID=2834404 RepID=UPI0030F9AD64
MIHYILQTIAFQLVFLLAYDVFLKKETFFKWNRLYLLVTAILSLMLPFIKVESFKKVVPQNYVISLPEVILGQSSVNPNNPIILNAVVLKQNSMSFWEVTFYIGLCIAFCLFLYKVFKIFVLVIKNPKQSIGNIVLVELLNSNAAFSFFHYIFLGEHIKAEDKETILKHELIHTKQKHTLDLLFFELLRIVFWFNPFVYMYQNRMATLHEFIADANAVKHQDKNEYYQNLLEQVFETKKISFINTFFKQSLIKKRIVMLSKTKS